MNSHAIMADFKRHINDLEKPQKFIGDKMIEESDKTLSHLSLLGLLGEVRSIWSCGRTVDSWDSLLSNASHEQMDACA